MMTDLDLVVAVIPECVHGCSETNVTNQGIEPFTIGSRLNNVNSNMLRDEMRRAI